MGRCRHLLSYSQVLLAKFGGSAIRLVEVFLYRTVSSGVASSGCLDFRIVSLTQNFVAACHSLHYYHSCSVWSTHPYFLLETLKHYDQIDTQEKFVANVLIH